MANFRLNYTGAEINEKLSQIGDFIASLATKFDKTGGTINGDVQVIGALEYSNGWKDNVQPFSAARGNGTTEPSWINMGNSQYGFQFTPDEELFVQFHVDHDYALGTNAYPHIHFLCTDTQSAGNQVTWSFNYTIAKGHSQGESLTGAQTEILLTYTYTGNEVAGEHIVLECEDVDAFDLIEPDTLILARVRLVSESISGSIFGLMADLHYQADRESTISKSPDFYTP